MSRQNYIFTSESVSEGHPDKVCDRISDAILDAFLTEDPEARVACETFATTNRVVVGGEVRLRPGRRHSAAVEDIARACITRHRLRAGKVSLGQPADRQLPARAVGPYRAGRRCGRQQGRRRGRSGDHVRLCVQRDTGADAGADPLCACDPAASGRGAQGRHRTDAAPGCKIAAVRALRGRQAGRGHLDRAVDPAYRSRRRPPTISAPSWSPISARFCPTAG